MTETFLEKIVAETRSRVAYDRLKCGVEALRAGALEVRSHSAPHRLRAALDRRDRINIIAEIKRASPSKGVINDTIDVAATAKSYASGGSAAISVLTEGQYFGGSLADLKTARAAVDIPLLRKDFIVDAIQIYEAAAAGADAVLLIVAALSTRELNELLTLVRDELAMDALVEVHTAAELAAAAAAGADIIGVNNRDLHSLAVSLDVSRGLINERPDGALMIAESGITTRGEIDELRGLGFDGFLIGETLMRSGDLGGTLRSLSHIG